MGVIYKLKDEVVQFIISQRQSNPLSSCRQLAESVSQKFGLNLSKSSVHDVLKESGITTPRGRKPKDKFKIPQEKKKQIQVSLSQVKLISGPPASEQKLISSGLQDETATPSLVVVKDMDLTDDPSKDNIIVLPQMQDTTISAAYEGAGRIFLKAALWDLGIFSEENVKDTDLQYYLTYTKGIKVVLENNKDLFIDLPLPIERCIRETADGLINNVKPLFVHQISDEALFKASMEAQEGFKIINISIVDRKDHILFEISDVMEFKRVFILKNRIFVDSNKENTMERTKTLFFLQTADNNSLIDNILNLKGFDTTNKDENTVTLLVNDTYENKTILQEAAEILNGMFLMDDQGRLVKVVILSEAMPASPAGPATGGAGGDLEAKKESLPSVE